MAVWGAQWSLSPVKQTKYLIEIDNLKSMEVLLRVYNKWANLYPNKLLNIGKKTKKNDI